MKSETNSDVNIAKHYEEAEKAILYYLLWNAGLLNSKFKDVKPHHFVNLRNRVIFNKIYKLHTARMTFNFLTLPLYFDCRHDWAVGYIDETANNKSFPTSKIDFYKDILLEGNIKYQKLQKQKLL